LLDQEEVRLVAGANSLPVDICKQELLNPVNPSGSACKCYGTLTFLVVCVLALAACGGKRSAAPFIETNNITETAVIPMEVIEQYHANMDRARELAQYDRLAWVATDSV
jgi:hypothetical protein